MRVLLVFAGIVVLLLALALSRSWCGKAYWGRVVDADTGAPLVGAVAAVVWHSRPIIAMDGPEYFHNAREDVTDAHGGFRLSGCPGIDWNPLTYVKPQPWVVVFKPRYWPLTPLHMVARGFRSTDDLRGAAVSLPPLRTQEEIRLFQRLSDLFLYDVPSEKVPNLRRAIDEQSIRPVTSSPLLVAHPLCAGPLWPGVRPTFPRCNQVTAPTGAVTFEEGTAPRTCSIDGNEFQRCEHGLPFSGLSEGWHRLVVRDPTGGLADEAVPWQVDATGPPVVIVHPPELGRAAATGNIRFRSGDDKATFGCRIDDGAFQPCTKTGLEGGFAYEALRVGEHTATVRATDEFGNYTESTRRFVVEPSPF